MLTTDLVRARVKGGALSLSRLSAPARKEAVRVAAELVEIAQSTVGEPRESLLEAFRGVEAPMRLEKVRDGLAKLLTDACDFEEDAAHDPVRLRQELFARAAEARRASAHVAAFDRGGVLASEAARLGLAPEALEEALFSDLRGSHRLLRAPQLAAEALVASYELALEQAVLLRAERVVVDVRCRSASAYRALFRRIKFLRLMCVVDAVPDGTYRLTIDGPASLFGGTTRYGLELAMVLPLLREVDRFSLAAVVRWGPTRERATFDLAGGSRGARELDAPDALPEELDALVRTFRTRFDDYDVAPSDRLVELRGEQILVPDLVFRHRSTGFEVQLELLGHHSRDALFRRVELAPRLPVPMIFAASSRLRVREEALPESLPACLYVFKGTLRAGAVHERLESLRATAAEARSTPPDTARDAPPGALPGAPPAAGRRRPKKTQ